MNREKPAHGAFWKKYFSRDILVYGGVEAAFWSAFTAVVFLSTALADSGFSGAQTGTIMAVRNVVGMVATAVVANWTDKIGSPRRMMLLCASVAAILTALIPAAFGVKLFGTSLGVILIFVSAFFNSPMYGLCESWVVQAADRKKTFSYGSARYFGSFFYAIVCIGYGALAKRLGGHGFTFYAFGILCVPLLLLAIYTKRDEPKERVVRPRGTFGLRRLVKNYYFLTFLACYTLSSIPMQGLMTFLSYKLLELNGSTNAMGALTALRSFAEIPSLILCAAWIKKAGLKKTYLAVIGGFGLVQMLLFAARGMALVTAALFLIGFVNGAYMVCQIRYVHAVTPPEARASGVSLCVSASMISGVLANLCGGFLTQRFSTNAYFLFGALCAALSAAMLVLCGPVGNRLGFAPPDLDGEG